MLTPVGSANPHPLHPRASSEGTPVQLERRMPGAHPSWSSSSRHTRLWPLPRNGPHRETYKRVVVQKRCTETIAILILTPKPRLESSCLDGAITCSWIVALKASLIASHLIDFASCLGRTLLANEGSPDLDLPTAPPDLELPFASPGLELSLASGGLRSCFAALLLAAEASSSSSVLRLRAGVCRLSALVAFCTALLFGSLPLFGFVCLLFAAASGLPRPSPRPRPQPRPRPRPPRPLGRPLFGFELANNSVLCWAWSTRSTAKPSGDKSEEFRQKVSKLDR